MHLSVKALNAPKGLLKSDEVKIEQLDSGLSVSDFRQIVTSSFGIRPEDAAKLLFKGKPLQDGTNLGSYGLSDGAKLHLMLKPGAKSVQQQQVLSGARSKTSAPATSRPNTANLRRELFALLRRHLRSEDDARRVLARFERDFDSKLSALSLDDIERICKRANQQERKITF